MSTLSGLWLGSELSMLNFRFPIRYHFCREEHMKFCKELLKLPNSILRYHVNNKKCQPNVHFLHKEIAVLRANPDAGRAPVCTPYYSYILYYMTYTISITCVLCTILLFLLPVSMKKSTEENTITPASREVELFSCT